MDGYMEQYAMRVELPNTNGCEWVAPKRGFLVAIMRDSRLEVATKEKTLPVGNLSGSWHPFSKII
jgi:hypothetical protein